MPMNVIFCERVCPTLKLLFGHYKLAHEKPGYVFTCPVDGCIQHYQAVRCLERHMKSNHPEVNLLKRPTPPTPDDDGQPTRKHSAAILNILAPVLPELIGGSADLTHSNLTELKVSGDFQKGAYA